MKRHMGLVQTILEWVEEHGNGDPLDPPRLCQYEPKVVHFHVGLCEEAGYLRAEKISGAEESYPRYAIGSLTWTGYEVLDRFRST